MAQRILVFCVGVAGVEPSNLIDPTRDEKALMVVSIDPIVQIEESSGSDPALVGIFYF